MRREAGRLRRYVHLGTGNYNTVAARVYEDFGLFTADEEIAADVADLFNYLTGFGRPAAFRKLLVAPFTLRQRLVEEIGRREATEERVMFAATGQAGGPAGAAAPGDASRGPDPTVEAGGRGG